MEWRDENEWRGLEPKRAVERKGGFLIALSHYCDFRLDHFFLPSHWPNLPTLTSNPNLWSNLEKWVQTSSDYGTDRFIGKQPIKFHEINTKLRKQTTVGTCWV